MPTLGLRNPFIWRTNNDRQLTEREILDSVRNKFNEAFFWGSLGTDAYNDDQNLKNYIDYAYNINPDVYSVVNQISNKFTSIPYVIKEIEDEKSEKQLTKLNNATKYNYSIGQEVKAIQLSKKAYSDDYMDMPLEQPNPNQTWQEFWMLSETFLCTTGNCYWYVQKPLEGINSGVPISIYVLPSHLIEIELKGNSVLYSNENPIKCYTLIEGKTYVEFDVDEVVHIKYANPNYDESGSHLYGQSPLRAAYKNIVATNKGLDLSVNTMKNGGAFGFLHAKDTQTPLTPDQANQMKERLKEMDKSSEDLGRIAGISASIGFTRISLTTDELKPFEYFDYNLKQVCNVLGWDDKLLNNADASTYDNMKVAEKRVVSGKLVPDIKLFKQQFNENFLQLFPNYENSTIDFMVKELPEMQQDYNTMSEYVVRLTDSGHLTRNQGLAIMGMEMSEDSNMNEFTVKDDIMTLADAILPQDGLSLRE